MSISKPIYLRWWFLAAVAGIFLASGVGTGAAVVLATTTESAAQLAPVAVQEPTTTTTTATTTTVADDLVQPSDELVEIVAASYDFGVFRRAYDNGYAVGYQDGLVSGEIPGVVDDMYESDDPADFGYAAGYIDGWQVADVIAWALAETDAADPIETHAAPQVIDRGYEQGKADGYTAGIDDGWNGFWRGSQLVVGQGPEYTRGFLESYETYYDLGQRKRQAKDKSEAFNESLDNMACFIGGGCDG